MSNEIKRIEIITFKELSGTPATPSASGEWGIYCLSDGLYIIEDDGTEYGPFAAGAYLLIADIDDTPVNGVTNAPISSNWAYDHAAAADPHAGYVLESTFTQDSGVLVGTGAGTFQEETGATLRTSIGVGTGDSPQLTGIELGHASDTTITRSAAGVIQVEGVVIPSISSTNTLTNKRITKRVASTTDDATAVIDCDSYDEYYLTAVANNTEISVTGTPTAGQTIFIGLKDAGVSKTLTWTGITALGCTLPAATTAGKQHIIGIKYIASAWRAIAVAVEA